MLKSLRTKIIFISAIALFTSCHSQNRTQSSFAGKYISDKDSANFILLRDDGTFYTTSVERNKLVLGEGWKNVPTALEGTYTTSDGFLILKIRGNVSPPMKITNDSIGAGKDIFTKDKSKSF